MTVILIVIVIINHAKIVVIQTSWVITLFQYFFLQKKLRICKYTKKKVHRLVNGWRLTCAGARHSHTNILLRFLSSSFRFQFLSLSRSFLSDNPNKRIQNLQALLIWNTLSLSLLHCLSLLLSVGHSFLRCLFILESVPAMMDNGFSSPRHDPFPAGLRVLVVDDDLTWLKILEKMLKKCSYEGEYAQN